MRGATEPAIQFGVQLHPEFGADSVIREVQRADGLGYDSVWLYDHLMNRAGIQTANFPLGALTLAAAIGATTRRVRISWAVLNLGFYNPAVLAKSLATIDQITHGRVICTAGSGWVKKEAEAYNVPMIQDHDERSAAACEAIKLIKELWSHPAPERTTFTGTYFKTRNLPFQPAPFQRMGPPIWIGGESDVTLRIVKDHADGWVLLSSSSADLVRRATPAPDWPTRPMKIVKTCRMIVGETRSAALEAARRTYEVRRKAREAQIEQPGHPLVRTEHLNSGVQVVAERGETNLHAHSSQDEIWFVVEGEAAFYTDGDRLVAPSEEAPGPVDPAWSRVLV